MHEVILVGDMHAVPDELDDCQGVVTVVERARQKYPAARVVFLGDQHDAFGVVYLRVVAWMRAAFERLGGRQWVVALSGNHDRAVRLPATSGESAMEAYRDLCELAAPRFDSGPLSFVSHDPDPARFVDLCRGCRPVVVCHQTFRGAVEDGRPLRDGVEPGAVGALTIISGHIHSPQSFDNVIYPGAPRWRTRTDAKVDQRQVVYAAFAEDGRRQNWEVFPTAGPCRPIRVAEDRPEAPLDPAALDPAADHRIDVYGPLGRVEERAAALRGRAVVRTFPDRAEPAQVSEAQGVPAALLAAVGKFESPHGTPRERLAALLRERRLLA